MQLPPPPIVRSTGFLIPHAGYYPRHTTSSRYEQERWCGEAVVRIFTECYNGSMVSQPPEHASPSQTTAQLTGSHAEAARARARQGRTLVFGAIVAGIVLLAILVLAVYVLLQPGTPTDRWRDIFIIMVALESLVIGVALVVLLIQLASLINLVQNELRPILDATSETVNNLRGTAQFLGESVVEPVIKLNGYLASVRRVLELMGIKQR